MDGRQMWRAAWAVLALLVLMTGSARADEDPGRVLEAMFEWWNEAYQDPEGFTPEAFARYYTEDAVMLINGNLRGVGPVALARHFRNIQAATEEVEIILPFDQGFSDGDRTFTSHLVRSRREGEERWERVVGYALITDGRIALINFVGTPAP